MNAVKNTLSKAKIGKMSSEWLVVVYDKQPENDRLKFRGQHLQNLPKIFETSNVTSCGPMFTDTSKTKFVGSYFTLKADSREEIIDFLKQDIFGKENVWDFDNILMYPVGNAGRIASDIIVPPPAN